MFGRLGYEALGAANNNLGVLSEIVENLSNIKSIGYKKSQTTFVEALNGEITRYQTRNHSQGPLRKTGEAFDLALDGQGFFEIEMPNGQKAFTRAGRFGLNADGELVTEEGYRILPQVEQVKSLLPTLPGKDQALNIEVTTPDKLIIPADLTPEITEDGTINGINPQTNEKTKIGKVSVVVFNNVQGLESLGKGYYVQNSSSGQPIDIDPGHNRETKVKQGFLEFGNVDMAAEFMNLSQMKNVITAQMKVLKVLDKIYENVHYTISKNA